jgi:G patch domain and KOW motifs-containing protein
MSEEIENVIPDRLKHLDRDLLTNLGLIPKISNKQTNEQNSS